jgi:UDP-N-acetylglucosamine transferase subunit ALG13
LIFVTVGFQMPFDRLVRAVDAWAGATGRRDVFAQTGDGEYRVRHIEAAPWLELPAFRAKLEQADAIVSHAGMGTILSALELGKPLLVLPRRVHLAETRSDHQVATAHELAARGWLLAAEDESELPVRLAELAHFAPGARFGRQASPELLGRLRAFTEQVASGRS